MKKKLLFMILCITMMFTIACGTETSENENVEEIKKEEQVDEEDNSILKEELFKRKVKELTATYGKFKAEQTGIMYTTKDEWLDPNGIVSSTIFDFDMDGETELLVCQTKLVIESDGEYQDDAYQIEMNMYEAEDEEAVLKDSKLFSGYVENSNGINGWTLSEAEWTEMSWNLHIVEINNRPYLMCEDYGVAASFADGSSQDYWLMEYANNRFQYICAFTQTGGGSSDFEYTGYEFSNGKLSDVNVYYNEYEPELAIYDDFFVAITEFFKKYDISLDMEDRYSETDGVTSVLSENNEKTKIFEFKNRVVASNYKTSEYKYVATLEVGEE